LEGAAKRVDCGVSGVHTVMILGASAGLGTYAPGVRVWERLRKYFPDVQFDVIESYFTTERLDRVVRGRQQYQRDFMFALMAQKYLRLDKLETGLAEAKVAGLLSRWRERKEQNFVVFSGFWLPILKRYRETVTGDLFIDAIQMDAVLSLSWQRYLPEFGSAVRIRWLFPAENGLQWHLLTKAECEPAICSRRLLLHGGGWQLGNYAQCASTLRNHGYSVLMGLPPLVREASEPNEDTFMISPEWETWSSTAPYLIPFELVESGVTTVVSHGLRWFRRQTCDALAIVSKPGGATLLDSISTATPVVFTEPYGAVEEANAALWCARGFGIQLSDWATQRYSPEALLEMTDKLDCTRNSLPTLLDLLIDEYRETHGNHTIVLRKLGKD
jgi:hypothetical protein